MKAADISDEALLDAVRAVRWPHDPYWAMRMDVEAHLSDYPPKVVLAKARKLIKRGLLGGCGCGCRGDWHILDDLA